MGGEIRLQEVRLSASERLLASSHGEKFSESTPLRQASSGTKVTGQSASERSALSARQALSARLLRKLVAGIRGAWEPLRKAPLRQTRLRLYPRGGKNGDLFLNVEMSVHSRQ